MSSPTHDEEEDALASKCDETVPAMSDESVTPMKTSVTPSRSSSRGSSPSPSSVGKTPAGSKRSTTRTSSSCRTKCTCTTRQHETKSNFLDFEVDLK
jgi:hypothetical protein